MKRQFRAFVLFMIFGTAMSLFLMAPIKATSNSEQEISLMIPGSDVRIRMRQIPAGTFMMGSPSGESGRDTDEGPWHEVVISQPFYIGIYEVTQAQWDAVMGTNPSKFGYIAQNPVEQVSWEDCQKFITKLNSMGVGTFRLPIEAEWEYACRAGSTTRFPWGDDPSYTSLGEYAWNDANSDAKTHPVGQKKPNAWGLYDMHGNVWEWCSDWYGSYTAEKQINPKGPATGSYRVFRGGSWYLSPVFCRSAERGYLTPSSAFYNLGFRLVRTSQ